MKLYHSPHSPNCRKVTALAKHLGLELQLEVVDLQKGANKESDFLALNPNGKVPVLVDGDTKLWESNAIMAYLAGKKDSDLWPKSQARYDIMRWQFWQTAHLGPAVETVAWERVIKPMMKQTPNEDTIKDGLERFDRYAAVLNGSLEGKKWLTGDKLTLADLSIGSAFSYAAASKLPLDQYKEIGRWLKQLDEIPAWKATEIKLG